MNKFIRISIALLFVLSLLFSFASCKNTGKKHDDEDAKKYDCKTCRDKSKITCTVCDGDKEALCILCGGDGLKPAPCVTAREAVFATVAAVSVQNTNMILLPECIRIKPAIPVLADVSHVLQMCLAAVLAGRHHVMCVTRMPKLLAPIARQITKQPQKIDFAPIRNTTDFRNACKKGAKIGGDFSMIFF